jgi:hypothetical protein
MKKKYFNAFLQLSAFLVPIYFIFYHRLNENQKDPFIKSLWWFLVAGFCFYGVLAIIFL